MSIPILICFYIVFVITTVATSSSKQEVVSNNNHTFVVHPQNGVVFIYSPDMKVTTAEITFILQQTATIILMEADSTILYQGNTKQFVINMNYRKFYEFKINTVPHCYVVSGYVKFK